MWWSYSGTSMMVSNCIYGGYFLIYRQHRHKSLHLFYTESVLAHQCPFHLPIQRRILLSLASMLPISTLIMYTGMGTNKCINIYVPDMHMHAVTVHVHADMHLQICIPGCPHMHGDPCVTKFWHIHKYAMSMHSLMYGFINVCNSLAFVCNRILLPIWTSLLVDVCSKSQTQCSHHP